MAVTLCQARTLHFFSELAGDGGRSGRMGQAASTTNHSAIRGLPAGAGRASMTVLHREATQSSGASRGAETPVSHR